MKRLCNLGMLFINVLAPFACVGILFTMFSSELTEARTQVRRIGAPSAALSLKGRWRVRR